MQRNALVHRYKLHLLQQMIGEAEKEHRAAEARPRPCEFSLSLKHDRMRRAQHRRRDRLAQLRVMRGALDPTTAMLYHAIVRTSLVKVIAFARLRVKAAEGNEGNEEKKASKAPLFSLLPFVQKLRGAP